MKRAAVATLASGLLLAACGDSSGPSTMPCTTCINVAGTYTETGSAGQATCGSNTVTFGGDSTVFTVTQSGSALTVQGGSRSFGGVLHDDNSVTFDSTTSTARGSSPWGSRS